METHGFKVDLQAAGAVRKRFHDPGPAARPACGDGRPIRPEPLEPPMRERQDGAAGLRRERDVDLGLPRPDWIRHVNALRAVRVCHSFECHIVR